MKVQSADNVSHTNYISFKLLIFENREWLYSHPLEVSIILRGWIKPIRNSIFGSQLSKLGFLKQTNYHD